MFADSIILSFIENPCYTQSLNALSMKERHDGEMVPMIEPGQTATLMIVYGAGFLLVFLYFALLYGHAYKKRMHLDLNNGEIFDTISGLQGHVMEAGIGLVAVVLALFIGNSNPLLSSVPYWFIGPIMTLHGVRRGKDKEEDDA
jgi:cytochrome c biogenesis protein CcdA